MTRTFLLTRTRSDGTVYQIGPMTERQARSQLLYALRFNLGTPKREANKAANDIREGEPFAFGQYVFLLEEAS